MSQSILIIEDEATIAELERDYLEINGYKADIEINGERGLKKALSGAYDLIILDLMLPKIDGFELCRQIRQKKEIPILLLSAKKEEIDKIRGLGLGADDYMTKPFSPNELVARVKAHLSRYDRLLGRKLDQQQVINLRGLTIDPITRRVTVRQQEIPLTIKEYDLLNTLASHPDRVFTKEELFEKIWGYDAMGDTSTVTVHVRKVREKIERDPTSPEYIETVWGVGYRFPL